MTRTSLLAAASCTALMLVAACDSKVTAPNATTTATIDAIAPAATSIAVGQTIAFTATLTDQTGRKWIGTNLAWAVSDSDAADISSDADGVAGGSLTGKRAGFITVTAIAPSGSTKSLRMQVSGASIAAATVSGTNVYPSDNLASKVNSAGSGTTFIIKAGTHRQSVVSPKSNDKFIGEPGAILSGAKVLTGWVHSGSTWYVSNQKQRLATSSGVCLSGYSACNYSEDLFMSNALKRRVTSLSQVKAGTWYFDRSGSRIYVGDNPAGKTVETSQYDKAFTGYGSNVTISNLVIEKYGSKAQMGAIAGDNGSSWTVNNNEVRYNHGGGIKSGQKWKILSNFVHHNGQLGIGGYRTNNVLVEKNEISYNNTCGFSPYWEAGGTKFSETQYLIYHANFAHHNYGKGLWTDFDNIYVTYDGNTVSDNQHQGISHEVGYNAVIKNNIVLRNGFSNIPGLAGAGIGIVNSPNVEIYGNTVTGNAHGIVARMYNRSDGGSHGTLEVRNFYVHDNTVDMSAGETGLLQNVGNNGYYTSKQNRFVHNTYILHGRSTPFYWQNANRSKTQWTGYGQDKTGIFK